MIWDEGGGVDKAFAWAGASLPRQRRSSRAGPTYKNNPLLSPTSAPHTIEPSSSSSGVRPPFTHVRITHAHSTAPFPRRRRRDVKQSSSSRTTTTIIHSHPPLVGKTIFLRLKTQTIPLEWIWGKANMIKNHQQGISMYMVDGCDLLRGGGGCE